ncbi:hypothetical protein [Vulgatibacter sp.]|uniref:hypothetical protein n=1 Tax=Vulgatibacter sp. TaxID=1971226 RepID=UPI0035617B33
MHTVISYIEERQAKLARHPFFSELHTEGTLEELLAFAPRLGTWVHAFQLVLRINGQGVQDPELRTMLVRHAAEEGGHDTWFFEDVAELYGRSAAAGVEASETDRMALALMKEAGALPADELRLVFLLALEATSELFFDHVTPLVEAKGGNARLRYFGRHHQDAEDAHTVFEAEVHARVEAIALDEAMRSQAKALVDRIFASFALLFDGLRAAPPFVPKVQRQVLGALRA